MIENRNFVGIAGNCKNVIPRLSHMCGQVGHQFINSFSDYYYIIILGFILGGYASGVSSRSLPTRYEWVNADLFVEHQLSTSQVDLKSHDVLFLLLA